MKYSFYWKLTNGKETYFAVENNHLRWSQVLDKAVKNLPFEQVNDFSELENSNFHKFVLDIYRTGTRIMEIDGTIHEPDSSAVANSIFNNNAIPQIKRWRSGFDDALSNRTEKLSHKMTARTSGSLNNCLIYFAACDIYEQWVLEESRFFSLSLLLDSFAELEASLLLASNFYYKQAVYVLRNFIELIVAQFYFSSETSVYDDWRLKSDYKMPTFTGKEGMTAFLKTKGKIDETEKASLDRLFRKLSAYTHSKYEKLLHYNPETKKVIRQGYNERYLMEWADLATECTSLGLVILSKHTKDWESKLEGDSEFLCPECLNNQFDVKVEEYGHKKLYLSSCKKCGSELRTDRPIN